MVPCQHKKDRPTRRSCRRQRTLSKSAHFASPHDCRDDKEEVSLKLSTSPILGITLLVRYAQKQTESHSIPEAKCDRPDYDDDSHPDAPAEEGVTVGMSRVSHDPFVEELASHVRVDGADDDRRDEHKSKRGFASPGFRQRADGRRSGVLTHVVVSDCSGDGEQDQFHAGERCERLGEVFRLFHLGDERGVENLADPKEGDAESQLRVFWTGLTHLSTAFNPLTKPGAGLGKPMLVATGPKVG